MNHFCCILHLTYLSLYLISLYHYYIELLSLHILLYYYFLPLIILLLYSVNNIAATGIIITNEKSTLNPIIIHNNENIKNIVFLGIILFNLLHIDFNNPVFIINPTPARPIIIVPRGVNLRKLFILSDTINFIPLPLSNDSTVKRDVDDEPSDTSV